MPSVTSPSIWASSSVRGSPVSPVSRVSVRFFDDLLHLEVLVAKGRQLRQVGDDHHLVLAAQTPQFFPDRPADAAADALVNFIEDERGNLVGTRQHILECQHQAGSLAAGGDLCQRFQAFARVRLHQEFHFVQPVAVKGEPGAIRQGHAFGSGLVWKSTAKRAEAMCRSSSSVSMAWLILSAASLRFCERARPCSESFASAADSAASSSAMRPEAVVMVSNCFAGIDSEGDDGLDAAAVLALQAVDQVEAFLHFLQPLGVVFDRLQVIAQAAGQVGEGLFQRDGLFRQGFLGGVDLGQFGQRLDRLPDQVGGSRDSEVPSSRTVRASWARVASDSALARRSRSCFSSSSSPGRSLAASISSAWKVSISVWRSASSGLRADRAVRGAGRAGPGGFCGRRPAGFDIGVAVEQAQVGMDVEQREMLGLAVDIHQDFAQFFQQGQADDAAIDAGKLRPSRRTSRSG